MTPEILLVRHGQAQSAAQDEASYDSLSPQGQEQARRLGAWLAENEPPPARITSGALQRQRQTAALIGEAMGLAPEVDPRLDELDYFGLSADANARHALPFPTSRETFLTHLPQIMAAWAEGRIDTPRESHADFEARIRSVLDEAAATRVMLVTSGGVIAMAMKLAMELSVTAFSHVALQIENSSLHRLVPGQGHLRLDLFNGLPHLSDAEGRALRSHV
ncbi:histidine phosphatase family protein [Pseudoroseicyclus sp. CXY001]|uniref:histidine phosphatase family protein n=1 Tax=Pseudoroseicyclus sp. CXY001 TaxID=3242492 RepID=UPI003570AB21